MRHLLDEILEIQPSHASTSSCGCGCPSCAGKVKLPTAMETETWLGTQEETNSASTTAAVAFNRRNAALLGWDRYFDDIIAKVLRLNFTPEESYFATLIAEWQFNNGLTPDGKLGQNTWTAMKPILGIRPSSNSVPPPTIPTTPSVPSATTGPYVPYPCPVNQSGIATDRCISPQKCPPIPNLLCMKGVGNIPFEYVNETYLDRQSGLERLKSGQKGHTQKFVPNVRDAIIQFTENMARFGMPIHTILTLGSLYCRCIRVNEKNTNSLSNHSYGEAIDVAGVRWKSPQSISRVEDTLVRWRNLNDAEQGRLLRRIGACLRLSFPNVIDYHRSDHRDHFHCDLNRGGRKNPKATINFVQEMLGLLLQRKVSITGEMDVATYRALSDFSGFSTNDLQNMDTLNKVYRAIFEIIAAGKF